MLENFIYSVNVTFPIFLVMVIGWFLRQRGMFNDNFINIFNKVINEKRFKVNKEYFDDSNRNLDEMLNLIKVENND